ncbi:hypothetical protein [Hymenobacter glacieicola]|uniref:CinA C-terminal domain-containing protein n=1 Tax=Hymenobacter glacieicola TaxID=1562124 RepID=A0ABQ1X5J7_9BACT|nr:hypothetical protein [Hymenobacter glacieicola]GGG60915.1 hypothetical protein GCM10011378_41150 [Hymenobacter glacieicola]
MLVYTACHVEQLALTIAKGFALPAGCCCAATVSSRGGVVKYTISLHRTADEDTPLFAFSRTLMQVALNEFRRELSLRFPVRSFTPVSTR